MPRRRSALRAARKKATIAEGNASFPVRNGKPVAMHHHRCACGCRILSSLENVSIA
ncbi:PAAR domain-containing protein [Paraburkholderia sp. IW21]|uniref:PAAR domain-containing protein n=1 Tax=Paraburkholderia sp. IW21 TaxID=3242488 RepID=UPI00351FE8BF